MSTYIDFILGPPSNMQSLDKVSRIDEITLTYLVNRQSYSQYMVPIKESIVKRRVKERRFYRKRIYDITKQLLGPTPPQDMPLEVTRLFEVYSAACIDFFKGSDTNDILQDGFDDFHDLDKLDNLDNLDEMEASVGNNGITVEEANNNLMRSIKITEPNCLERMVKRTRLHIPVVSPPPSLKNINLKDPALRVKGIAPKFDKEAAKKEFGEIKNIL